MLKTNDLATVVQARGRWMVLGWGLAALMLGVACGPALQQATPEIVRDAQERWNANPIPDYRIVVEVDRPAERRRIEIVVQGWRLERAQLSYWNPRERRWGAPTDLRGEQGLPFTPPGLLETVQEELANSRRSYVRIAMGGQPPFPQRILLGPVHRDGTFSPDSEAAIRVELFEPLNH